MAKRLNDKSVRAANKGVNGPDHLTLRLFAPGMSAMHRAGLGGLAGTLESIKREYQGGRLRDKQVPGAPWKGGKPPWELNADEITLHFGEPDKAAEFLERLFAVAFVCESKSGLIALPGQWRQRPTSGILADLQQGLTLTFLQHGKTRTLVDGPVTASHDADGDGRVVHVEYRQCTWFKHQEGWKDVVNVKTGALATKDVEIEGPLNPGAVVRHNAFPVMTKISEPVERLLALYFAMVGCVALPVNRGVGVLLVPAVDDLNRFAAARPTMTPRSGAESMVAAATDAALQLQLRMKGANRLRTACHALTLRSTPWASQQKSRVEACHVPALLDTECELFERALAHLPSQVAVKTEKQASGKGKAKKVKEVEIAFRTVSIIRPLIAENLARGQSWYTGFTRLMIAINPATNKPYRQQVLYESCTFGEVGEELG